MQTLWHALKFTAANCFIALWKFLQPFRERGLIFICDKWAFLLVALAIHAHLIKYLCLVSVCLFVSLPICSTTFPFGAVCCSFLWFLSSFRFFSPFFLSLFVVFGSSACRTWTATCLISSRPSSPLCRAILQSPTPTVPGEVRYLHTFAKQPAGDSSHSCL